MIFSVFGPLYPEPTIFYCKTKHFETFLLFRKSLKKHRFWHPFWSSFWELFAVNFRTFSASIFGCLFGCLFFRFLVENGHQSRSPWLHGFGHLSKVEGLERGKILPKIWFLKSGVKNRKNQKKCAAMACQGVLHHGFPLQPSPATPPIEASPSLHATSFALRSFRYQGFPLQPSPATPPIEASPSLHATSFALALSVILSVGVPPPGKPPRSNLRNLCSAFSSTSARGGAC